MECADGIIGEQANEPVGAEQNPNHADRNTDTGCMNRQQDIQAGVAK